MWNVTNPRLKEITTYKMKAILKAPKDSVIDKPKKSEESQKPRLLNIATLLMLIVFLALIPVHLIQSNYFEMTVDLVMLVVCSVIFLLCFTHANTYIKRACTAEKMAIEAQQQAERQKAEAEKNMMLLQKSVDRIMRNHAMVMNRRTMPQIPLAEYEPRLWPLINAFNSLQNRLQHTRQTEDELQHIKEAISMLVELIRAGNFSITQPIYTKTALDPLISALQTEQKGYIYQEYSPVLLNLENTWIKDQLSISRITDHGIS